MISRLVGADIKEMQRQTMAGIVKSDFPEPLSTVAKMKKPIIAAVNGFAVRTSSRLFL